MNDYLVTTWHGPITESGTDHCVAAGGAGIWFRCFDDDGILCVSGTAQTEDGVVRAHEDMQAAYGVTSTAIYNAETHQWEDCIG